MKKKMFFIILIMLVLFSANPVFARNIASCETPIPGAMIDEKIPNTVATVINIIN